MSKSIRDFFLGSKSNHNNSNLGTDVTIIQRKQLEELRARINLPSIEELSDIQRKQLEELRARFSLKNLPSIEELYSYMLTSINKSIVKARNMEIITGYSPNITATISDSYDDVIEAILAEPQKALELDPMAMRLLKPFDVGERPVVKKKDDNELRCDKIIARSWFDITCDYVMLLPEQDRIDPELIALHRANVDLSVQNWRYILDTIVKVMALLTPLIPGNQQSLSPSKT